MLSILYSGENWMLGVVYMEWDRVNPEWILWITRTPDFME